MLTPDKALDQLSPQLIHVRKKLGLGLRCKEASTSESRHACQCTGRRDLSLPVSKTAYGHTINLRKGKVFTKQICMGKVAASV